MIFARITQTRIPSLTLMCVHDAWRPVQTPYLKIIFKNCILISQNFDLVLPKMSSLWIKLFLVNDGVRIYATIHHVKTH